MTAQPHVDVHEQQGFGKTMGFGSRAAVIVVDFQRGLTEDGDGPLAAEPISKAVDRSLPVLETAADGGTLTVYTKTEYRPDGSDSGVFGLKVRTPGLLVEGSRWSELDPRLPLRDSDVVMVKKMPSAFFGTPLTMVLTAHRVDTVILVGCVTSGCIRATAVDAMSYGYRVIVPDAAVGDRDQAAHIMSLQDIQRKYGDVCSVEEVRTWLSDHSR